MCTLWKQEQIPTLVMRSVLSESKSLNQLPILKFILQIFQWLQIVTRPNVWWHDELRSNFVYETMKDTEATTRERNRER